MKTIGTPLHRFCEGLGKNLPAGQGRSKIGSTSGIELLEQQLNEDQIVQPPSNSRSNSFERIGTEAVNRRGQNDSGKTVKEPKNDVKNTKQEQKDVKNGGKQKEKREQADARNEEKEPKKHPKQTKEEPKNAEKERKRPEQEAQNDAEKGRKMVIITKIGYFNIR